MSTAATPVFRIFFPDAPPGGVVGLLTRIPGSRLIPLGIEIPLTDLAPEEILSLCLRHGVTARATRIVTRTPPG